MRHQVRLPAWLRYLKLIVGEPKSGGALRSICSDTDPIRIRRGTPLPVMAHTVHPYFSGLSLRRAARSLRPISTARAGTP